MGFVVDAVSDVYDVSAEQRRPAPDFGSAAQAGFVTGLATIADKMVILLDIDRQVESRMGPQPGEIAQEVPLIEVPKGNI
jgi:purine-binding chemotaxis protein CheW